MDDKLSRCLMITFVAAFAWNAAAQDGQTYAERLGWPKGSRVVIFHSDDAGMCHQANVGTIKALEYGILTSASTMMPCPWVPEFADYLKEHPNVDNGIHVTLTSEWGKYRWGPLMGQPAVPGLVDEEGCLWPGVSDVVEHATADEVDKEMRAQLDKALKMGMPVTHIDTHMGTVFGTPEFFMRYVALGVEKKIPVLIAGGHLHYASQENAEAVTKLKESGIVEMAWKAGLPVLDDIHTDGYGWKDAADKKAQTIEFLRTLKPGVTQFILHCTQSDANFDEISTSGETRLSDLQVMTDPDIKKVIEEEGIILTTWREMMERRQEVAAAEAAAQK